MDENLSASGGLPETFIGICRSAEDMLGIRMLTPECEIIAVLFDVAKMTPLELLQYFKGSNTSFYKLLGDLEAKGALVSGPNPVDGRSKLYRLSDLAEDHMSQQWQSYKTLGRRAYATSNPNEVISRYTRTFRTGLKVSHVTAEFQILLHVHSAPGISSIQFSSLVDVSPSKFNDSLRKLKETGYIYFRRDASDRRRKSYFLPDRVTEIFVDLDKRIFAWLDSKVDRFDVSSA